MSDEKRCETCRWQYKTTTLDRSDGTVFWDEASRWLKLDELGDTEWELCQIEGQKGYDTAWVIFKRRVSQGERKDKPAGPFRAASYWGGPKLLCEGLSNIDVQSMTLEKAEELAECLNKLWAEREVGE